MKTCCHRGTSSGLLLALAIFCIGDAPRALADLPKRSDKARPDVLSDRDKFADYRDWKGVTKEPIAIPGENVALCAPARAPSQRGPHADGYIAVYVSPNARDAYLAAGPQKFVEGAVIVKEKLKTKTDKHPLELGIMIKRAEGYDPEAGDWQFLFVDKDDHLVSEPSEVQNCRTCHQLKKTDDFVFRKLRTTLDLSKAGKVKQ